MPLGAGKHRQEESSAVNSSFEVTEPTACLPRIIDLDYARTVFVKPNFKKFQDFYKITEGWEMEWQRDTDGDVSQAAPAPKVAPPSMPMQAGDLAAHRSEAQYLSATLNNIAACGITFDEIASDIESVSRATISSYDAKTLAADLTTAQVQQCVPYFEEMLKKCRSMAPDRIAA